MIRCQQHHRGLQSFCMLHLCILDFNGLWNTVSMTFFSCRFQNVQNMKCQVKRCKDKVRKGVQVKRQIMTNLHYVMRIRWVLSWNRTCFNLNLKELFSCINLTVTWWNRHDSFLDTFEWQTSQHTNVFRIGAFWPRVFINSFSLICENWPDITQYKIFMEFIFSIFIFDFYWLCC